MKTKISKEEWNDSQEVEIEYWKKRLPKNGEPGKSEAYFKELKKYIGSTKNKILVDVGAGPRGILSLFESKLSIAIDPLMKKYRKIGYSFKGLKYLPLISPSENMPLLNDFADYVFSTNALDHAEDAKKSFNEMVRILKPGGRLFLIVHLRKNKDLTDRCHKMWFTKSFISKMAKRNKLKILYESLSSLEILTWDERKSYVGIFKKPTNTGSK